MRMAPEDRVSIQALAALMQQGKTKKSTEVKEAVFKIKEDAALALSNAASLRSDLIQNPSIANTAGCIAYSLVGGLQIGALAARLNYNHAKEARKQLANEASSSAIPAV